MSGAVTLTLANLAMTEPVPNPPNTREPAPQTSGTGQAVEQVIRNVGDFAKQSTSLMARLTRLTENPLRIFAKLSRRQRRLLIIGVVGVSSALLVADWTIDNYPLGLGSLPEKPTVMVVINETRNVDTFTPEPGGACERQFITLLSRRDVAVGGEHITPGGTLQATIEEIGSNNWWRARQPVHVMVWGKAIAKNVSLPSDSPRKSFTWDVRLELSASIVDESKAFFLFNESRTGLLTTDEAELSTVSGNDPFERLVKEAVLGENEDETRNDAGLEGFLAKLDEAWAQRLAKDGK